MGSTERISLALRRARRDGVGPATRHALELVREQVFLEEEHVWYQLDVGEDRPRRELPGDVRLLRAGDGDLRGVVEMGQRLDEVRRRRSGGNDVWLAIDDGGPLFRCWIYRGRTPVLAAPGGWLVLPPGTVCLEDSATSPRARGRGVAPGAWTGIADALRDEGVEHMITKVGVENAPSRKAVSKAGFRELGVMRLVKRGPRKQTTMTLSGAPGLGADLAARLGA